METRAAAISYIKSLTESDKERIKTMLSHGIMCGADYARQHNIEPALFSQELKLVFGGK